MGLQRTIIPDVGQKGYSKATKIGNRDFLNVARAYTLLEDGVLLEVETYKKANARVLIQFVSETGFRLRMYPGLEGEFRSNAVFDFAAKTGYSAKNEDNCLRLCYGRLQLQLRLCPWEMIVLLDGQELTREHIRDFNVDQNHKALPLGFTLNDKGEPIHAFDSFYMHCDEGFYGFGEKFTGFNKRGQKITIWQRDALSTNSDVSYKAMPYFFSSEGYAVLLNTYTRCSFDMGASSGVSYTMEAEDPYLDYYLLGNREFKGLVQDYTALSGRSPMIPKWAFGLWMSRMSYMTRQELQEVVEKADDFGLSLDVVHIDGWMGRKGGLLEFDEERFPDPPGMVRWLKERGVHLSLWMFPYVPVMPETVDGKKTTYGELAEKGYLVKNKEGGPCAFLPMEMGAPMCAIDFTNPDAVELVKSKIRKLMRMGVGVIKTDFSEELPEDAVFYDGSTGLQSHNKYTLLYAKTIFEASKEAKDEMGERAMLWGRSGYAGSQNYPANWAGDSSSHMNNLAAILRGGLSMGLSGVSFWGYDVGGFYNADDQGERAKPADDEYIRSAQMGLLSPLSRCHGQATPREPWAYSEQAQKAFLKVNKLRYRMLPYVYSIAWETHLTGLPMMRAMLLEFQEDLNARDLSLQYMLGSSLLVAPAFDQTRQMVYLPKGEWVDFQTGKPVGDGWLAVQPALDEIPLFLRENSAVPMLETAPMHTPLEPFAGLTVYMNIKDELCQAYYDDGCTAKLCAKLDGGALQVEAGDMPVNKLRIYARIPVQSATLNGKACKLAKLEEGVYEVQL